MLFACFASKWAGLLPYLRMWEKSTWRNSPQKPSAPNMITTTEDGGGEWPHRALFTIKESPSIIKSEIPTSLANWKATSTTFASTSNAPKGAFNFWLSIATTLPCSPRIRTPIPTDFCALKTAPSKFILYLVDGGGDHLTIWLLVIGSSAEFALLYSARYYALHLTSASPIFFVPPWRTSLRFVHIDHAIVTTVASLSSSYSLSIIRCHTTSKNELMAVGSKANLSLVHYQVCLAPSSSKIGDPSSPNHLYTPHSCLRPPFFTISSSPSWARSLDKLSRWNVIFYEGSVSSKCASKSYEFCCYQNWTLHYQTKKTPLLTCMHYEH